MFNLLQLYFSKWRMYQSWGGGGGGDDFNISTCLPSDPVPYACKSYYCLKCFINKILFKPTLKMGLESSGMSVPYKI